MLSAATPHWVDSFRWGFGKCFLGCGDQARPKTYPAPYVLTHGVPLPMSAHCPRQHSVLDTLAGISPIRRIVETAPPFCHFFLLNLALW